MIKINNLKLSLNAITDQQVEEIFEFAENYGLRTAEFKLTLISKSGLERADIRLLPDAKFFTLIEYIKYLTEREENHGSF